MRIEENFIISLKDIVLNSGLIALEAINGDIVVEYKDDNSPVTSTDKQISDYIYAALSILNPKIPIICEEQEIIDISNEKYFWLVDPIDGTRSFIEKKDSFTINIALIKDKQPVIGFIYQPTLKRLYYTDENGNFCLEIGGIKNVVPPIKREGFVAIVSSNHYNKRTENYLKRYSFSDVIAIPSSIKLCMIAEGVGDVHPKFGNTMEWDIAAGHAIIKAAGGEIFDFGGNKLTYSKPDFRNPDFLVAGKRWLEYIIDLK